MWWQNHWWRQIIGVIQTSCSKKHKSQQTRRRTFGRELRDTLTAERRLEMSGDVVIDELCETWMRKNGNGIRRRTFERELRDTLTAERRLEMSRDVVIDELCDTREKRRKQGDVIEQWTPIEMEEIISPVNNYLWFLSQLSSHQILRNDVAVENWKRVDWCEARMLEEQETNGYMNGRWNVTHRTRQKWQTTLECPPTTLESTATLGSVLPALCVLFLLPVK